MKKWIIIISSILLISLIAWIYINYNSTMSLVGGKAEVGRHEDVNIQSPHPYPNSDVGRKLVWSEILSHPNATYIRLHFSKFEVRGNMDRYQIPADKYIFPQELFDNRDKYINGDFIAIRNKDGKVIDIITSELVADTPGFVREDFWSESYTPFVDTIIIELYADESDNGYGLYIDSYSRGYTKEEYIAANR